MIKDSVVAPRYISRGFKISTSHASSAFGSIPLLNKVRRQLPPAQHEGMEDCG